MSDDRIAKWNGATWGAIETQNNARLETQKEEYYPGELCFVDGVSKAARVAPSYYGNYVEIESNPIEASISNLPALARELWKMMFEFPVLAPCIYCESVNAVTNSNCCQCGAPMGQAHAQVPGGYRLP